MPPDTSDSSSRSSPSDAEILKLFQTTPHEAWNFFIEKHSDFIFTVLRRAGFDYDEAMERFIYVCEKLCEQDFRRLKTVKYAGQKGDLMPWLRQVTVRLSVNWLWAENGRKRLFKPIGKMSEREQRIFQLYFWRGQKPSEIYETLRLEHDKTVEPRDVFDALENIFSHLSDKKLWNLMSGLLRAQKPLSLDKTDDASDVLQFEPIEQNLSPENELIKREENRILAQTLENLSARERLVINLRYEDTLAISDIAKMLGLEEREVKNLLKSALYKLRKVLC